MIKESGGDADLEEMAKQNSKDTKAERSMRRKAENIASSKGSTMSKEHHPWNPWAAGGDNSALRRNLLTMYQKYAEAQDWRFEVMEASMNGVGGFKEKVVAGFLVDLYAQAQYESGAHRIATGFL